MSHKSCDDKNLICGFVTPRGNSCQALFDKESDFQAHKEKVHVESHGIDVNEQFKQVFYYFRDGVGVVECPFKSCDVQCSGLIPLQEHYDMNHCSRKARKAILLRKRAEQDFICKICYFGTRTEDCLLAHLVTTEHISKSEYADTSGCDICKFPLSDKYIPSHMRGARHLREVQKAQKFCDLYQFRLLERKSARK